MDKLQEKMIHLAIKRYKTIYPCSSKSDLSQCFTTAGPALLFWFNTEDHSTKLIKAEKGIIQLS